MNLGRSRQDLLKIYCDGARILVAGDKDAPTKDCGVWDGIHWVWAMEWRRPLRDWEVESYNGMLSILEKDMKTSIRHLCVAWENDDALRSFADLHALNH
ncbi:hypothetical protein PIB30_086330 [Stylosanthes scabra]|uniref:Uncharacterized protein n=1 Tax=Stylosanthes scabra TaxID=79078 RepID=A0ABU6RT17_9FABA|nr:hypothetical protein [Stylosanthes scabra]